MPREILDDLEEARASYNLTQEDEEQEIKAAEEHARYLAYLEFQNRWRLKYK